MIIRVIAKNIFSFKETTEFNTLTSSKIRELPHHKLKKGKYNVLKFSAIYGNNASGKSNLIKIVSLIDSVVTNGELPINCLNQQFRFDNKLQDKESEVALEFIVNKKSYFYALSFLNKDIIEESLYLNKNNSFVEIFSKKINKHGEIKINFNNEEGLQLSKFFENILNPKNSLMYYIGNEYKGKEKFIKPIKEIYNWFENDLLIIYPNSKPDLYTPFIFDKQNLYKKIITDTVKLFNLGIDSLDFRKKEVSIKELKENLPENFYSKILNEKKGNFPAISSNDFSEYYYKDVKNDKYYLCEIIALQSNKNNELQEFKLRELSDGTNRLIDFIPMFISKINTDSTVLIDEIERSLHPNMIKEILKFFSGEQKIDGQLIFSTHESLLLDLDIFRQDEIWFTEKNPEGATEFYSLNEFSEHHTKDIRKGYLNGRYGAIPFLGNFQKLITDKDAQP